MSQWSNITQSFFNVLFENRCLVCRQHVRKKICASCLRCLELDSTPGSPANLFQPSFAVESLLHRLNLSEKIIAAYLCVRLIGLEWPIGRLVARCEVLEGVAKRASKRLSLSGKGAVCALDIDSGNIVLEAIFEEGNG